MTSGVEESSCDFRSRFSTAAPPTLALDGRSARSRSTVVARAGSEGSTVGTAEIRAYDDPSAAGTAGRAPAMPGSPASTVPACLACDRSTTTCRLPGAPLPKLCCTWS